MLVYYAGLDIGSTITKLVIRKDQEICAAIIRPTGAEHRRLAHQLMQEALDQAKISFTQIDYLVATGYGRVNVPFADAEVSEISCHMRGVSSLLPSVRTIIDIGGQDCKGIKVVNGKMRSFVMNDKCAAGTGRFLEIIAESLGVELEDIGNVALQSENPVTVSKTCTVYAEQEILLHLAEGVSRQDIIAGLHKALAGRIYSMVSKLKIEKDVAVTGGGAKNNGLLKCLEQHIGFPLLVPSEPFLTGALGASIIAEERAEKARAENSLPTKEERKLEAVTFFGEGSTR
jgi:predicted CoA-substrate-specific enzyme activase